MAQILLVYEGAYQESLRTLAEESGGSVCVTAPGEVVEAYLAEAADLVLLDISTNQAKEVLQQLLVVDPSAQVVALSERSSIEEAITAIRAGAAEYVQLPMDRPRMRLLLEKLQAEQRTHAQLSYFRSREAKGTELESLVGQCQAMRTLVDLVFRLVRRSISTSPPTVLLLGETGTGKGCIARAIHFNGRRRDQPFVEVNCAAIPDTLLEGELFGHEKGAFTDARLSRIGLIETAHSGTLFLDEVGCLPPTSQAKLLTFLEDKRIRRLGSSADRQLDVQVIAASNRDLEIMTEQGTFRLDLLHRLQLVTLTLPPLRERGEDRVALAEFFLQKLAQEYGQPMKKLSLAARQSIEAYDWPGNVRELRNTLERIVLLEDDENIRPDHLQLRRRQGSDNDPYYGLRLPSDGISLEELERRVIAYAMRSCQGNVSRAARFLRISRQTLRYRLKRMG